MGDFSPESIAKLIPIGLLAFMAVLAFFGAFLGLLRAWKKSLLRFSTIVIALILALLLTSPLTAAFDSSTLERVFEGTEGDATIEYFAMIPTLLPLALGLVRPVLFLVLFLVLTVILWFIYFIISLFVRIRKPKKKRRLVGALIGALQGLLVALVILTPVFGYMSLVDETLVMYRETVGDDDSIDEIVEVYETFTDPLKENAAIAAARKATDPLFKAISSFRIDDKLFVLSDEIGLIFEGYSEVMAIMEGGETEMQLQRIREVADLVQRSAFLPNITSELLAGLGSAWSQGEDFVGIESPDLPKEVEGIANKLFSIFASSTKETLGRDIDTILDIATLYFDYNLGEAFGEGGNIFDKVTAPHPETGKTFIVAALEVLDSNPHMQPLRNEVLALGFSFVGDQLGTPAEIRENYGDMANEAAAILRDLELEGSTDEEKIANLTPTIKEQLAANEMDLPDEVVDEISKHFLEELANQGKSLSDVEGEDLLNILIDISANGTVTTE